MFRVNGSLKNSGIKIPPSLSPLVLPEIYNVKVSVHLYILKDSIDNFTVIISKKESSVGAVQ